MKEGRKKKIYVKVRCAFCDKEILKAETSLKHSKSGNFFCDKSCKQKLNKKNEGFLISEQLTEEQINFANDIFPDFYKVKQKTEIPLTCAICKNDFFTTKHKIFTRIKKMKENFFCSRECSDKFPWPKLNLPIPSTTRKCFACDKIFIYSCKQHGKFKIPNYFCCSKECHDSEIKKRKQARKEKNIKNVVCVFCEKKFDMLNCEYDKKLRKGQKNVFCSRSCSSKYCHKMKLFKKSNRSKQEDILCEMIKFYYPDLELILNDRNVLKDNLEIDILIPSKKLAIELNGPTHYFPIYGEKQFGYVQDRDIRKQIQIQQLGLNLIVINTSKLSCHRRQQNQFLQKEFDEKIKPIIDSLV